MSGDIVAGALAQLVRREAWTQSAACVGMPTEMFFPGRGESASAAKVVCEVCPVAEPCLDYALRITEKHGIWGGTSERERRMMRSATHRADACEDAA